MSQNPRIRKETGDQTLQRKVKAVKQLLDFAARMSLLFPGLNFSVGIEVKTANKV